MKNKVKVILLFIMIATLLFSNPTFASWLPLTQDFSISTVVTIAKKTIYDFPNGKKIGTAYKGSSFEIIEDDGKWIKVQDNDRIGYIKKKNTVIGEELFDYICNHQGICKYKIMSLEGNIPYYKNKKLTQFCGYLDNDIVATKFTYDWIQVKIGKQNFFISSDGVELIPIYKPASWR